MIALLTLVGWATAIVGACALFWWIMRLRQRVLERRAWDARMARGPWWS